MWKINKFESLHNKKCVYVDEKTLPKKTKNINLTFDITLTKSQQLAYDKAMDDFTRQIILLFSRQSGKSVLAQLLCIQWLTERDKVIGYCTPTFKLGKKVFREVVKKIKDTPLFKSANSSDLVIEGVNGSTLQFFSGENIVQARGFTFDYLIIDECAFMKETTPDGQHTWNNILQPTTKVRCKKTIFISTPNSTQGFFYDAWMRPDHPRVFKLKRTIYDDALCTPDYLEELKTTLPAAQWEQEYMCNFISDGISYIKGYKERFSDYSFNENLVSWIGVDLSGNGEDDTILTKINTAGQTVQYNIKGSFDDKYRFIAEIINSTKNLKKVLIECNGLGEPMINEIKKLVVASKRPLIVSWTTTNESKATIVNLLALWVQQGIVSFQESNETLFEQFGYFQVKLTRTGKVTFGARDGLHDDHILSLCIACQAKSEYKETEVETSMTLNDKSGHAERSINKAFRRPAHGFERPSR